MRRKLDPDRPRVPDVLPIAVAYMAMPGNEMGGPLHVVLCDPNHDDATVRSCLEEAEQLGCGEAVALANLLLAMTPTQRGKLARLCSEAT